MLLIPFNNKACIITGCADQACRFNNRVLRIFQVQVTVVIKTRKL